MSASATCPKRRSPFRVKGVRHLGTRTFFDATAQGGPGSLSEEIREPRHQAFIERLFLPPSDVSGVVPMDHLTFETSWR